MGGVLETRAGLQFAILLFHPLRLTGRFGVVTAIRCGRQTRKFVIIAGRGSLRLHVHMFCYKRVWLGVWEGNTRTLDKGIGRPVLHCPGRAGCPFPFLDSEEMKLAAVSIVYYTNSHHPANWNYS